MVPLGTQRRPCNSLCHLAAGSANDKWSEEGLGQGFIVVSEPLRGSHSCHALAGFLEEDV